jgi:prephenate dehydrogenase
MCIRDSWRAVGARPRWTGAAEHDRLMSWCSHLPQLASNALARVLEQSGHVPSDLGTGGTDMVRLAGSSPEMWLPLLARSGAGAALRDLARTVGEVADALDRRDLEAIESWMSSTRSWRAGAVKPLPPASSAAPDHPARPPGRTPGESTGIRP